MNGHTRQATDESPCPKRLWILTTLSDDEGISPGDPLPQGLEFHLSRCPSCRALADELLAVTADLHEVGGLEPPDSLSRRADRQTKAALKDGARMTGRVDVGQDGEELLGQPIRVGWRRWSMPIAAAAMVAMAVGVYAVMSAPGGADSGATPAGVVQVGDEAERGASTKEEEPKATLARDGVDRDPTALPEEYRSDDCKGLDCAEKAFIPGRGRHPPAKRRLDTKPDKDSTKPVPNDR